MSELVKVTSKERIDILPTMEKEVKVSFSEVLPEEETVLEITVVKPQVTIRELGKNEVKLYNASRQTYSIYPDDDVLVIKVGLDENEPQYLNVATVQSDVQEAFAEEEDIYECPLCDKEYKTENGLKKHLDSKHGTTV